jgi:hypothetical protein
MRGAVKGLETKWLATKILNGCSAGLRWRIMPRDIQEALFETAMRMRALARIADVQRSLR